MNIGEYTDRILTTYSKGSYYDEIRQAKEHFFDRVGKVAEGSDTFEIAMMAFIDWYVFERPLTGKQKTPVELFLIEHVSSLNVEEKAIFEALLKTRHSIFELLKVVNNEVCVRDLFTNQKYIVEDLLTIQGFVKGDLFEARLVFLSNKIVFGKSFIFHPKDSATFIKKKVTQIRDLMEPQKLRLLHALASMKHKTEQYPHIDIQHIYTETPIF